MLNVIRVGWLRSVSYGAFEWISWSVVCNRDVPECLENLVSPSIPLFLCHLRASGRSILFASIFSLVTHRILSAIALAWNLDRLRCQAGINCCAPYNTFGRESATELARQKKFEKGDAMSGRPGESCYFGRRQAGHSIIANP